MIPEPKKPFHEREQINSRANVYIRSLRKSWIGTLTTGYFGQVDWFEVTPTTKLDGTLPAAVQPVFNIYNWDYGDVDAVVRVEWDPTNSRWIALQQEYECPPSQDPGFDDTTYSDPAMYPLE